MRNAFASHQILDWQIFTAFFDDKPIVRCHSACLLDTLLRQRSVSSCRSNALANTESAESNEKLHLHTRLHSRYQYSSNRAIYQRAARNSLPVQ